MRSSSKQNIFWLTVLTSRYGMAFTRLSRFSKLWPEKSGGLAVQLMILVLKGLRYSGRVEDTIVVDEWKDELNERSVSK